MSIFYFTTYERDQVVNTNPYVVKKSILVGPFHPHYMKLAMGLDYNFVSNDESDLGRKASHIVNNLPCPYSTFTTYEWDQVVNTNPYAVKKSILTGPLSPSLYEVCSHIAMGLDYNFVSNDESDLDNKASNKDEEYDDDYGRQLC
ncbi:14421_t:CDS:2 [Entrophospora sp. SA101]|nr:14421_t:CDS:2 [Entrophospora sp. SA101]